MVLMCAVGLLCSVARADGDSRRIGTRESAALPLAGSVNIPVVLVEFADKQFTVAASDAQVNDFFNLFCNGEHAGEYYKNAGSYGSVRDYFVAQSDSIFQPNFVVIGPVRLKQSYTYYGGNTPTRDTRIMEFYTEALSAAMEIHDDWSDFDNNNDHAVDMAYFIYAGEGENGSDDTNNIWPKENVSARNINGLKFMCYACCNELYKGECDGIGVMCHELSHALGLPDLYDTGYKAYGLDYWDLMDSGCYCLSSYHPCGYSAYELDFMGWRPLVTLERDRFHSITLRPLSQGGVGYKLLSPNNPNEYYIIENRQNTGWDTYIGRGNSTRQRHGLLVSHVDYKRDSWTSNSVNTNTNHQRFTIVPADGKLDSYMYVNSQEDYTLWSQSASADLYPGTDSVTTIISAFQPTYSVPGSMLMPITDIVEHADGTITLTIHPSTDTNLDGGVDTQDVLRIYESMAEGATPVKFQPEDVNADDNVDTQDVLRIYEFIGTH